jgi:spore coat protein CotH
MGGRRFAWVTGGAIGMFVTATLVGCGGTQTSPLTTGDGSPGSDLSQRPAPAVPIFDDTRVHDLSLAMSPEDWQSILDDSRGNEWRHATLTYDGVVVEDVGVRPAGESSRVPGNVKMSMRIRFDAFDGRGTFGGYRDISVKGQFDDGSMMRERVALGVFRALMPTPKAAHARVVVNDDLRGVYTLREIWDETSVAQHFSAPLGPLYRLRPPLSTDDPYLFVGTDPASYVPLPWDPQIKTPARGDDVVPALLQALTDPAAIETIVDVDAVIAYLVAATITMTTDGLVGSSGVDDHFQYFDPQTGKFFVLPWDPDNTFGSQGETPDKLIYSKLGRNVLTMIIRDRDDLRARYKAKIAETIAAFPLATLQAQADAIYAQIKDAAHEDPVKLFPNDTFDWNLTSIKDFAAARYANLAMQLGN